MDDVRQKDSCPAAAPPQDPMEALEQASLQYAAYLELADAARAIREAAEEPRPPVPNWRSPLQLTFARR